MQGVCGSSDAAWRLVRELELVGEVVERQNLFLRRQLQRLEISCHDDSLERAQELVARVEKESGLCRERLRYLQKILTSYSSFLGQIFYSCGVRPAGLDSDGKTEKTTGQLFHTNNGGVRFDSPEILARSLDIDQSKNGLGGSCGICACENVLRMAEIPCSEMDVYTKARAMQCCDFQGGTTCIDRAAILTACGCPAVCEPMTTPEALAAHIMSGKGVILSVDAAELYRLPSAGISPHAIVVTSVQWDHKGKILGFWVCDSNAKCMRESGAKFYPVQDLWDALTFRDMVVTEQPIR